MSEEHKGEKARSMDHLFAGLDRVRKNYDNLEKQSLESAKLYGDIAHYAGQIISSVDDTRRFLDPLRFPEIARAPTIGPVLEKMGTQVNTIVVHSDKLIAG